jgi:hypothetical protein
MKIYEIISEAVGGDVVYHSVESGKTAEKIMKSGMIKPSLSDADSDAGETRPVISTSRDQFYRFPYGGGLVQFVIDRQAIRSAGFKVQPFSYRKFYSDEPISGKKPPVTGNPLHKQEAEERIYHPKGLGIPIKKPFVIAIQVHPDILVNKVPKSFRQRAEAEGIEIQHMKAGKNVSPKSSDPPMNDPAKLKVLDGSYLNGNKKQYPPGGPEYTLSYERGDGTSRIIHPYYQLKDKEKVMKAYNEYKEKLKAGGSIDESITFLILY